MVAAKQRYGLLPTHLPGVELRVVPEAEVKVPKEVTELFYRLAVAYYKAKVTAEQIAQEQKCRREEIIKYAQGIPGLRGLRSDPDDCDVLLVRKETVTYDPTITKLAMGVAYPAYFTEELVATITIPLSLTSEEAIRDGLVRLLQDLGVPAQDVEKLLQMSVQLRVDEEKIEELLSSGRLRLPEGARTVEVSWAVEAEQLRKPKSVKRTAGAGRKVKKRS